MNKENKDPDTVDLKAPRLARYLQTAWKKHQNTVLDRYQTCSKARKKVLSDAIERHHPLQYTPSLLYPEGYQDGNWRDHIRESISNKPNQRPQIQLLEQGDLFRQNNRPVRVFRKSTNVSYLAAKAPMCLLNVQIKTKTQTKT